MKLIRVLLLFAVCNLYAMEPIEIIESIPSETILGNDDIRDADVVWPELFDQAKHTIDIEQFYISEKKGEALTPVIESIVRAAHRNVKIRIIADAGMAKTYPETLELLGKLDNITVHLFDLRSLTKGIQHSKYFIIDGESTFIGSQNFDWRALSHIHELGILIQSRELTAEYQNIFNTDWQMSESKASGEKVLSDIKSGQDNATASVYRLSSQKYGEIRVIPTFSSFPIIYNSEQSDETQIIHLIDQTNDSLKLQFLSYSPNAGKEYYPALDNAIRRAAARGVKVKMILSDWMSGRRMPAIQSLQAIPGIEIRLTTIPEHSTGYISYARVEHCKFIVADDRNFWLGTSNASKDYFHNGRNLGLVIENEPLANRMNRIFLKSWNSPYANPVDLCKNYESKYYGGE